MKISKFLKKASLLLLVFLFLGYSYLKFSWLQICTKSEMKYNASILDSVPSLPHNFLNVWDKVFPESRNSGMNEQLWSDITREIANTKYNNCHCDEIGYTAWNNDNFKFRFNLQKLVGNYRQFGYGLEYYSSSEKCFDFWINYDII